MKKRNKKKSKSFAAYWIVECKYADGDWEPMNVQPQTSKRKAKEATPLSALIGRTTRVVRFIRHRAGQEINDA